MTLTAAKNLYAHKRPDRGADIPTVPEVEAMDNAAAGLLQTSGDPGVRLMCTHVRRLCAEYRRQLGMGDDRLGVQPLPAEPRRN